jgi:hypothetical protein
VPIAFPNSKGCVFCALFRSSFSAVLEELAGVSASILEMLASGLSGKIVVLVSVLFWAVKFSNSS